MKTFKQFLAESEELRDLPEELNETTLSRVHQHMHSRNLGMITAHRGEHDAKTNVSRNKSLEKDLRHHGLSYTHVKGVSKETDEHGNTRHAHEHSYLVVGHKGDDGGHLKHVLTHLGTKYHQDSVIHKAHNHTHATLITTKPGSKEHGHEHNLGKFHPNQAKTYHSELHGRGQRKFTFGQEDDK